MSSDFKRGKVDISIYDTPEMRSLLKEAMDSLRKDSLVYPFISKTLKLTNKEVERHLAALLDYQEDCHKCAECPGLELCNKKMPHFRLRLERDGELLNRHYDPCEKMLSLSSFKERYIRCNFPAEWRDNDLRSIEQSVASRAQVIETLADIEAGSSDRWVYIVGPNKSGKTFILASFANDITSERGKGVFCDTESLLNELKNKSIKDKDSFDQFFSLVCNSSVLVLDNFGNEFKSEFVYTTILFPLLAYRDRENLPTAFASDFKIEQIVSMYRAKIGFERGIQLKNLLTHRCKEEFDITGAPIYK